MFRAKMYRRGFITLVIISIIVVLCTTTVYAAGEGDGGGGGPAIPLYMDWSYPANGETNVSVTPVIQCKYSHNVAQYDVKDRNATLFSLKKTDGTVVALNVYIADAQIEFDKRQYVYMTPVHPLENNVTYIVTAQEGVMAKNGMATEVAQTFRFTTGRVTVALKAAVESPTPMTGTETTGPKMSESEKMEPQVAKASGSAEVDNNNDVAATTHADNKDLGYNPASAESTKTEAKQAQTANSNMAGTPALAVWIVVFVIAVITFLAAVIIKTKSNYQRNDHKSLPKSKGKYEA